MNKERQRIAFAEARGWTKQSEKDGREVWDHIEAGIAIYPDRHGYYTLPDPNDLNAMHEAEKTLTNEQHKAFRRFLFADIESDHDAGDNENDERHFVSATAEQRLESFLKALGKWEEGE